MSKILKVGLIGCGNVVSYGHYPALTTLENVELVALADITPARRDIGKDWFNLNDNQLYEDYKDVLAIDEIDAVVVTVPQKFRRQIVLDAFAAGKHVLSEKPISDTPAIATELIQAADEAGLKFGIVHNYHFLPEYRQLKQMLLDGTIGDIRVAMMHFLSVIDYPGAAEYQSDWRHTMAAGGGVLMDMIHAVYLAEWLMADFRDAIWDDREPLATAKAGQRALELALGAYLSGVTGQVVTLPLDTSHPIYQKGIAGIVDVEAWEHSTTKRAGLFGLRSE